MALQIRKKISKKQDMNILDSVLKGHRHLGENSQIFIQFCLEDSGFSWSGPICVASLGRFFLKFKESSAALTDQSCLTSLKKKRSTRFAVIQVIEECSTLFLHFYLPANTALPYRIDNCVHGSSLTYYQKVRLRCLLHFIFHRCVGDTYIYPFSKMMSWLSLTFQGSLESDILGPGESVDYVWDNLNLPHKLVVQVTGMCC